MDNPLDKKEEPTKAEATENHNKIYSAAQELDDALAKGHQLAIDVKTVEQLENLIQNIKAGNVYTSSRGGDIIDENTLELRFQMTNRKDK